MLISHIKCISMCMYIYIFLYLINLHCHTDYWERVGRAKRVASLSFIMGGQ
jgi:hypothetical protein